MVAMLFGVSGVARATSGSITGTVTGGGSPLASDILIYLYQNGNHIRTINTDANGVYTFDGLDDGEYKVQFVTYSYNSANGTRFVGEYFNDSLTWDGAAPLTVSGGTAFANIDADLAKGGWVTGTITGDGSPVDSNITIYIYDAVTGAYVDGTQANADGTYALPGIPEGSYKLHFLTGTYNVAHGTSLVSSYYAGTQDPDLATPVSVTWDTETPDIDIDLPAGGWISGTVTGGGAALGGGIYLNVYSIDGTRWWGATYTDAADEYEVRGLPAGDYAISYSTYSYNVANGTHLLDEWYLHQESDSSATPVTVAVGAGTTADTDLRVAGSISGTVTGGGGPLDDVYVDVQNAITGAWVGGAATDADGEYTVEGLPAGSFRLWFGPSDHNSANGTSYMAEYYANARVEADATPVSVALSTVTPNIDADLEVGGSISGTVTGDGGPLDGLWVQAYADGIGTFYAQTDVGGHYTITGLPTGDYRIYFDPDSYNNDNATDFLEEYYNNVSDSDDATLVDVTIGVDSPNINADLEVGGSVSGTVTGDGGPVADLEVELWESTTGHYAGSANTDALGKYTVSGLATGSYIVKFNASSYNEDHGGFFVSEYYNDVFDWDFATPVGVTGGADTPAINGDLAVGGSISGTVTSEDGSVAGIWVYASSTDGVDGAGSYVAPDGSFTLGPLANGDYIVSFDPWLHNAAEGAGLLYEYYDNVRDEDDASPVGVALDADTPGIDADLETGGAISGTVTGDGGPLGGIWVYAYGATSGDYAGDTLTDANGHYQISGLYDGEYKVQFSPSNYNWDNDAAFLDEFYDNERDWDLATPVEAAIGEDTDGIDADLELGATLGGVVTGDGGALLSDVRVMLLVSDGGWYSTSTDDDGEWMLRGIEPDQYRLAFTADDYNEDHDTSYAWECWNDKSTLASADPLSFVYGEERLNLDVQLEQVEGAISGTVYEPDGLTPLEDVGVSVYAVMPGANGLWLGSTMTGADGTYEIGGLNAGTYYVEFVDDDDLYHEMLYNGRLSVYNEDDDGYFAAATPVSVSDGVVTPGIDAVMQLPSTLSGQVKDLAGNGIEDVHVTIWWDSGKGWLPVHTHHTDDDGYYDFDGAYCGLYPGTYKVQFHDDEGDLGAAWYLDSYSLAGARTLVVEADKSYELSDQILPLPQPMAIYRFYNVTNGTHFYTPSAAERDAVIARWPSIFTYEGVAYRTNPRRSVQPLYRFYNRVSKTHFYTASASERNAVIATWPGVFTYEGETYGVSTAPAAGSIAVYRFYNPRSGGHFYTSSIDERNAVIAKWPGVYSYEGVAFWLPQ